jgi:hypothetical protein
MAFFAFLFDFFVCTKTDNPASIEAGPFIAAIIGDKGWTLPRFVSEAPPPIAEIANLCCHLPVLYHILLLHCNPLPKKIPQKMV